MSNSSTKEKNIEISPFASEVVGRAGIVDEVTEERLLRAFTQIDRKKFIISGYENRVHEDVSFPIGFSQNSLRPSLLARLIGLIGIEKGMRVLEVGSGSGYGSALMLSCEAQVFCIEQAGLFAQQTRKKLDGMGHAKILIKAGDGLKGWPELAPFDAIVVTFPAREPGQDLLKQLKASGGKLVGVFGEEGDRNIWLYEQGVNLQSYQLEAVDL